MLHAQGLGLRNVCTWLPRENNHTFVIPLFKTCNVGLFWKAPLPPAFSLVCAFKGLPCTGLICSFWKTLGTHVLFLFSFSLLNRLKCIFKTVGQMYLSSWYINLYIFWWKENQCILGHVWLFAVHTLPELVICLTLYGNLLILGNIYFLIRPWWIRWYIPLRWMLLLPQSWLRLNCTNEIVNEQ